MVGANLSHRKSALQSQSIFRYSRMNPVCVRHGCKRCYTWWCIAIKTTPGIRGFTVFAWTSWQQWRGRWASRTSWSWYRTESVVRETRKPASETASLESSCGMYDLVCFISLLIVSLFNLHCSVLPSYRKKVIGYPEFLGSADYFG